MIYGTVRNLCPPKNLLSLWPASKLASHSRQCAGWGSYPEPLQTCPVFLGKSPQSATQQMTVHLLGLILLSLAAGTRLTSWLAGVFAVCRRFYLLYQHHTTLETVYKDNDMFGTNNAFSFLRMMVTASLPHRRFFKLPRAL